jgi:hypothetical protein
LAPDRDESLEAMPEVASRKQENVVASVGP